MRCVLPVLISIHALLAESDPLREKPDRPHPDFYPRSPCGERRLRAYQRHFAAYDFYPRSPCGERLSLNSSRAPPTVISIHALLAESDLFRVAVPEHIIMISIHALLAESDTPRLSRVVPTPIFLSTLSLRRATSLLCYMIHLSLYFYPRSPCGERLIE